MMRSARFVAILATLPAACTMAPSSRGACDAMPLATYSPQQTQRVEAEMAAAPADAEWPGFIVDYRILRQRRRAACGGA